MSNSDVSMWSAKGDIDNDTIVIYKGANAVTSILPEQIPHGLVHTKGKALKYEVEIYFTDILVELGLPSSQLI